MSKSVLVVAPHPDDETLGCGGTLLRHKAEGDRIHWLICTKIDSDPNFSKERIFSRRKEIELVARNYQFDSVSQLDCFPAQLDTVPMSKLVGQIGDVVKSTSAEIIYVPFRSDIHSDHTFVFDAVIACSKWFRYPKVEQVLVYETLSETDFFLKVDAIPFQPNVYVDIESYLDEKIRTMQVFTNEIGEHPFPRSEKCIRSLANLRGAASGYKAAEAFRLLKWCR